MKWILVWTLGCAGSTPPDRHGTVAGDPDTDTATDTATATATATATDTATATPPATAAPATSAAPAVPIEIPTEVAIPVGTDVVCERLAVRISVLSAETIAGRARARARIVVSHGDHEVDLIAGGPPIDVDGIRVRFVRMNGVGPVMSVDQSAGGWAPREE